eukprot:6730348-Pyramimonas_sp.AAC.2
MGLMRVPALPQEIEPAGAGAAAAAAPPVAAQPAQLGPNGVDVDSDADDARRRRHRAARC